MRPSGAPSSGLALVLGGGGARAAYQAGVIRSIARRHPELRFPIQTGVSAGAINATFLASFEGTPTEAADALGNLWDTLTVDRVFCAKWWALVKNFFNWGCRLASCGLRVGPEPRGLVDTESPDALSLIMFQSDYTQRLMELGEADAEAQCEAIDTLLDA